MTGILWKHSLHTYLSCDRLSKVPANPKELADVTEYVQSISTDQVALQQRTNNVMVCVSFI